MNKLLSVDGRPAEIIRNGTRRNRNPKWAPVHFSIVRFLDGQQPATAEVTAGAMRKSKPIRETETIFWRRVDALVQQGHRADVARAMAQQQIAEGLTKPAAF